MTPELRSLAVQYFREHEGVVNHFYLDVIGFVTVGVGFMLPNADTAADLDMVSRLTGDPASTEAKRSEWHRVKQQEKARRASHYKQFAKLDMPDAAIDAKLVANLDGFYTRLVDRFPQLPTFPESVQLGLLDMAYSLGSRGLFSKYRKFCFAVDRQDWTVAAAESGRRNVSVSRNSALRELFAVDRPDQPPLS